MSYPIRDALVNVTKHGGLGKETPKKKQLALINIRTGTFCWWYMHILITTDHSKKDCSKSILLCDPLRKVDFTHVQKQPKGQYFRALKLSRMKYSNFS